ncbi:MAG: site-2 protease family protein [Lachnospiraceae bacterium]|nr:site-2 protease family protein [Lachnospiraceae bacterium]
MKLVLFILIFSVIVIVHEGGHCIIGKANGIGVREFAIGLGPTIIGFKRNGTKYSIKALPFGGVCIFEGDDGDETSPSSFRNASVWARMATVAAGPLMNFVLAFFFSVAVIAAQGYDEPVLYSVIEGYPAEQAGLMAGDEIVRIDGKRIDIYRDITLWTMFNEGTEAKVVYRRAGQTYETVLTPKYSEEDGRYLFGFRGPAEYVKGNSFAVIKYSAVEVRYWIEATVKSVWMLFRGRFTVNDLSGPVGVAKVVGDVYEESLHDGYFYVWLNLFSLSTLLTANLGVMNLLPFPALDGGRLLFLIIEAVTKKKPSAKVEGVINLVGMSFLMVLMVVVMVNDIAKIVK